MCDVVVGSTARGRSAELKAAALLLERGHDVAVPLSDTGVDLVVDYRWRVQVKSTVPAWRVTNPRASSCRYLVRAWAKIRPRACDFFVLHAVENFSDRWWVIPSVELGPVEKTTIMAYEGAKRGLAARINEFEDRWDLLAPVDLRELCVA